VEGSDSIILSSRNQSALIKMSWPEGDIEWISSQPDGYLPMYDPYILRPVGSNFEHHYSQHAPYILPDYDNNSDTVDILIFDNGWGRPDTDGYGSYSRMVHYRINEKNMTIEQIRQYGKEYGDSLYTQMRGDADLLPNGNWLGTFIHRLKRVDSVDENGVDEEAAIYLEIDDQNNLVWAVQRTTNRIQFTYNEYRSERMDIYNPDANDLGIGTDATNLIPEDITAKYEAEDGT
jgi:hypothetical protein